MKYSVNSSRNSASPTLAQTGIRLASQNPSTMNPMSDSELTTLSPS